MSPPLGPGLIDWHAHMLSDRLVPPAGAVGRWPGVRPGPHGVELTLGGASYRPIDARTFEVEARLPDMDAAGVAAQVLSPPPYAVAFDGPPDEHASLARQQNEFLNGVVSARPDRFAMFATLPYGRPDLVDAELDRLEQMPGVLGVCLTAHRDDLICSPEHEAFWHRIADRRWVVFVHPADTAMCPADVAGGAVFGLGMPLATARTATAMITSGLFARIPRARVLLAHAGGAFPATVDRLERGWRMGQHPGMADPPTAVVRRCIWADALVYASGPLALAHAVFGDDRLVFGSDAPFAAVLTPAELDSLDPSGEVLPRLRDNGRSLYSSILADRMADDTVGTGGPAAR